MKDLNTPFDIKSFKEQGGLGDTVVETFSMGRIGNRIGDKPIYIRERPHEDTIKVNDIIKISNTSFDGKYIVNNRWVDSKGNLGAIYINITNYTPTGPLPPTYSSALDDHTFDGVGLISLLK